MSKSLFSFALSLVAIFITFQAPTTAIAGNIKSIFLDEQNRNELLVVTDQTVQIIQLPGMQVLRTYANHCSIYKDTQLFLTAAWAYPVLASVKKTCVINEHLKSLEEQDVSSAPTNAFYITYFGEEKDTTYFLFNARPWIGMGTVYVKEINRMSGIIDIRPLIVDVPGYSAAMSLNLKKDGFFYVEADTLYRNRLHEMNHSTLMNSLRQGATLPFSNVAQLKQTFTGLSLWMSVGVRGMLFGTDSSAYFVEPSAKVSHVSSVSNCTAFGLFEESVLHLCDDDRIILQGLPSL